MQTFADLRAALALLNRAERRQFRRVLLLGALRSLLETAGVASIMPFIAVVVDTGAIDRIGWLGRFRAWTGYDDTAFVLLLGALTFLLVLAKNAVSALESWYTSRFCYLCERDLSVRLLDGYLRQPYASLLRRHSATLAKNVLSEIERVLSGSLMSLLEASSALLTAALIVALLFAVDPWITSVSLLALLAVYGAIFIPLARRLGVLGEAYTRFENQRHRAAKEALEGSREIRLLGRERWFVARYAEPTDAACRNALQHDLLNLLPDQGLEALAFGGLVLVTLLLTVAGPGGGQALATVALFAFALYRLMPAVRTLFRELGSLRFHAEALQTLRDDFAAHAALPAPTDDNDDDNDDDSGNGNGNGNDGDDDSRSSGAGGTPVTHTATTAFASMTATATATASTTVTATATATATATTLMRRGVAFDRVGYRYPGAARPALHQLSFEAPAGLATCLTGPTGAGKTTTLDLLLGLLRPDRGAILIDGRPLTAGMLRGWQRRCGYVPQAVYLADASVAGNIAWGVPPAAVDPDRLERAARLADVHRFVVDDLEQGYETPLGERGARLSGGQRQRLGIARALYRDPEILVFDEATSALDRATAERIVDALLALRGPRTLLFVTHQPWLARRCDRQVRLGAPGASVVLEVVDEDRRAGGAHP